MSENLTLETANKKLVDIITEMEKGDLSLQDSMKKYEEAFKLLNFCYKQLDECKIQITDISNKIEAMKQDG